MPISPIPSTASATSSSPSFQMGGALGKDEFMKLLVAQMQAQDPLNPMDNSEFISQLAQFSSLEQLQNINDKLDDLTGKLSNAANLINHEIEAVGTVVSVNEGVSDKIRFELDADATSVFISINDSNGSNVRNVQLGPLSAGGQTITWDGTDDNGAPVTDGKYTVNVQATGADGHRVEAKSLISGNVTGATMKDGVPYLIVGDNEIPVSSVTKILEGVTDG